MAKLDRCWPGFVKTGSALIQVEQGQLRCKLGKIWTNSVSAWCRQSWTDTGPTLKRLDKLRPRFGNNNLSTTMDQLRSNVGNAGPISAQVRHCWPGFSVVFGNTGPAVQVRQNLDPNPPSLGNNWANLGLQWQSWTNVGPILATLDQCRSRVDMAGPESVKHRQNWTDPGQRWSDKAGTLHAKF